MATQNYEHFLKEIVFFINENLKKNKKKENRTEGSCFYPLSLQKIESNWPLKKGSVDKNIIAWNVYEKSSEVVNDYIGFIIKSLAIGIKKNNSTFMQEVKFIENIFYNKYITGFFWDDIKKYYQSYSMNPSFSKENRTGAVRDILPHSSCVALCLDASFFRLRSGTNQELSSFEFFIEDLYNANNKLIVFSRQKLIHQNKQELKVNNYSISFKLNQDIIKSSIYEALEPHPHLIQSSRFIEPNKTGCFDRLIDILTAGQNYVENIEQEFKKWKNETTISTKSY